MDRKVHADCFVNFFWIVALFDASLADKQGTAECALKSHSVLLLFVATSGNVRDKKKTRQDISRKSKRIAFLENLS